MPTTSRIISEHYFGLLEAGLATGRWSRGVAIAATLMLIECEPRSVEHWIDALDEMQASVAIARSLVHAAVA